MADLLQVGVQDGVPNSGTGDVDTINALIAMVASQATLAAVLAKLTATLATATATIANGGTLSGAIDLGAARLIQIQMPAAWTSANLTFQTSSDGVTFANLFDSNGQEYTVVADVDQSIVIPRDDFIGTRHLKVRSGPASLPVAQGAARNLTLVLV